VQTASGSCSPAKDVRFPRASNGNLVNRRENLHHGSNNENEENGGQDRREGKDQDARRKEVTRMDDNRKIMAAMIAGSLARHSDSAEYVAKRAVELADSIISLVDGEPCEQEKGPAAEQTGAYR